MKELEQFELMVFSGRQVMDLMRFLEMAEELIGYAIYTHELVEYDLWLNMQIAVLSEYQWRLTRKESPIDSMKRVMKGKPVIAFNVDTGETRRIQ